MINVVTVASGLIQGWHVCDSSAYGRFGLEPHGSHLRLVLGPENVGLDHAGGKDRGRKGAVS